MPENPRHAVPRGRLGKSAGSGVAAAAVTTLTVWGLGRFGVAVPPEVATAAATVAAWALALVTPEPYPESEP